MKHPPRKIDLLDAVREMSRSAHRWRDRAAAYYDAGKFGRATNAKNEKDYCYELKEQGIVALHQQGRLRYAGASPQGMAVYEYADGGLACLHSCLHPVGAERTPIPDHPETLEVAAKRQRVRIFDAILTIAANVDAVAVDTRYERVAPPRKRSPLICWECGEEGHIARHCPDQDDSYEYAESIPARYLRLTEVSHA